MRLFKKNYTTTEIVHMITNGEDNKALDIIYKDHYPKIKSLLQKKGAKLSDIEDVFQDSIVVLYKYIKTNKYDLKYDINAFLYGVSKNYFLKLIQKNNRYNSIELSEDFKIEDGSNVEAFYISEEKNDIINALLNEIGDKCKELISSVIYLKKSMKLIALEMNYSNEDAAKTAHYKCKQKLTKLIQSKKGYFQYLFNND